MSRICQICDKWPRTGNSRSHSNKASKRIFKPNIFNKNISVEDWFKIRIKICSSCYKKFSAQWKI